MSGVAFPVEASAIIPEAIDSGKSTEFWGWASEASVTVTLASDDTITLWPHDSSTSESAYSLPSEAESSSIVIITTSHYPEPSQEPPQYSPPKPEPTTTTTTTTIETTAVEYPPPSSSFPPSSSSSSVGSPIKSITLRTGETSIAPEPPQPTETDSAAVRASHHVGFVVVMLGVLHVLVGIC